MSPMISQVFPILGRLCGMTFCCGAAVVSQLISSQGNLCGRRFGSGAPVVSRLSSSLGSVCGSRFGCGSLSAIVSQLSLICLVVVSSLFLSLGRLREEKGRQKIWLWFVVSSCFPVVCQLLLSQAFLGLALCLVCFQLSPNCLHFLRVVVPYGPFSVGLWCCGLAACRAKPAQPTNIEGPPASPTMKGRGDHE